MKNKRIEKENGAKALDVPVYTFTGEPHIEIIGTSQCVVDGLKGILQYGDDLIKLNLGKNSVTFRGENLSINSFTKEGAIVEGYILSIDFSEGE